MQSPIGGVYEEDEALRVIVGIIGKAEVAVYYWSKDEVVCHICRRRGKASSSCRSQARQHQSSSWNANLVSASITGGDGSKSAYLLLASKTLSKLSAEMRSSIQGLEEKITEHHAILHSVQERNQSMDDRIRLAQVADRQILESVCAGVDRMDHSAVEARHSGKQIMDYLNAFSGKIQGHLQSNLQTYQLMLQTQQNIAPRPTNLLKSNIRFEDALGEIKELPYEYFRHWEVETQSVLRFEMSY